jgi:hypothetical protein
LATARFRDRLEPHADRDGDARQAGVWLQRYNNYRIMIEACRQRGTREYNVALRLPGAVVVSYLASRASTSGGSPEVVRQGTPGGDLQRYCAGHKTAVL